MATENRDWGYTRIQGALANLRHEVGRNIPNILREHGLEPAPERLKKTITGTSSPRRTSSPSTSGPVAA
jgi:hypothetical protein